MHELPAAVLQAKDARDAQRDGSELVASRKLRLKALDLEGVTALCGQASCEALERDGFAIAVVGRGPPSRRLDLTSSAGRWAVRVPRVASSRWLYSAKNASGLPLAISSKARRLASIA